MTNFEITDEIVDVYTQVEIPTETRIGMGLVHAKNCNDLLFPSYETKFKNALAALKTSKVLRKKGGKFEVKSGRTWTCLALEGSAVTRSILEQVNSLLKTKKLGKNCIDVNRAIRKTGCSIVADETNIPRVLVTL